MCLWKEVVVGFSTFEVFWQIYTAAVCFLKFLTTPRVLDL